jgi:hypothetical protein
MKSIIQISLCLLLAGVMASCETCKIDPPVTGVNSDRQAGAKAAAQALTSAISQGSLEANYHNVVNTTYVTVGQDDVAFYLLLQAYNCESKRGHTAQADALLRLARQELARRHKTSTAAVAANPATLTMTEKKVLKGSPLKQTIAQTIEAPKATPSAAKKKSKGAAGGKPSPTPGQ